MGIGKSDHQAVAVQLVPECSMGGPPGGDCWRTIWGTESSNREYKELWGNLICGELNGGILCWTVSSNL